MRRVVDRTLGLAVVFAAATPVRSSGTEIQTTMTGRGIGNSCSARRGLATAASVDDGVLGIHYSRPFTSAEEVTFSPVSVCLFVCLLT